MNLTIEQFTAKLDCTLTNPTASINELQTMLKSAKHYNFHSVLGPRCFNQFKTEFVKNQIFINLDALKLQLADYVNWFNNRRIHSSLDYLTPVEYRMNNLKKIV